MADKKNKVNPLTWDVPIVNKNGTPTGEFMRKWLQQATTNGTIPDIPASVLAHNVLIGPSSGGAGAPGFRLLVVSDIPDLSAVYDVFGAAAAAQAAAEAYASNASNLTSGTVAAARLPLATTTAFGAVKPDGTTVTISAGVISAVGGGGGALDYAHRFLDTSGQEWQAAVLTDDTPLVVIDPDGVPVYVSVPPLIVNPDGGITLPIYTAAGGALMQTADGQDIFT